MIRYALRSAALIALALACALPPAAQAIEKIPFSSSDGLIRVQATVDRYPASLVVDLGAGLDVLSQSLGSRVVDVNGKYVTLTLTGQRVDLPVGTVGSITLGQFNVDNHVVGIFKGLDGTGIDGLLSAEAFRNVTATFDFPNQQILIEDAETFYERTRFAARVPLLLQDELGIALGAFARFDFGHGVTGLCSINTGLRGISIDRRFAAKLGVNLGDPSLKAARTPLGEGVTATIPSLSLIGADATLSNPQVVFGDLVYDCNVGNEFWQGKTFTLDIPHHVMYVVPPG